MKTMAPNIKNIINDTKAPLSKPLLILKSFTFSIFLPNLFDSNNSFVNAFTFTIPVNTSSNIEFDLADSSCAFFDNFLTFDPKTIAIIITTAIVNVIATVTVIITTILYCFEL